MGLGLGPKNPSISLPGAITMVVVVDAAPGVSHRQAKG